jgi:guanyl-specific ribonuclease Sa
MKLRFVVGLCAVLAACSSSEGSKGTSTPSQDAAADTSSPDTSSADSSSLDASPEDSSLTDSPVPDVLPEDVLPEDAQSEDTSSPDGGPSFETCEDTCAQTLLTLVFGNAEASIDRAQFGFNLPDNGEQTLHVEAHFGGDPVCPSQSSPTPDRTVIFANVPIPTDSTPIDGTPVTLLDFEGSLSPNPFDKATQVTLIPVAARMPPPEAAFVAFEVEVVFPGGTMVGHVYASHCDSMDE